MRVGILGGTFDPIHYGHLALADAAHECVPLDSVLLVPAQTPPHKTPGAVASPEQRLVMCRLACEDREWLGVWDVEVRRRGPSYTMDTLCEFRQQWPGDEPYLILGWDAARELGTWHRSERVLELARLVVVPRPGLPTPGDDALQAAGLDSNTTILCPVRTPPVEATAIRELVAAGQPTSELLPAAVQTYIREHGLYRFL